MIEREVFDWGVRLTAYPFKGCEHEALVIRSEVRLYKPKRGCKVSITFPAASLQAPLRLLDAQTWNAAMTAIIDETRAVQAEMKNSASNAHKREP